MGNNYTKRFYFSFLIKLTRLEGRRSKVNFAGLMIIVDTYIRFEYYHFIRF